MRILHSLIVRAFRDLQSPSKKNTVEMVSKMCVSNGIKTSKATILAELERVLSFIHLCRVGKDGKEISKTSSETIKEGSAKKGSSVIAMDEYDDSRLENTVPIVSHPIVKDLKVLSSRPYLKISSNAMNSEDFSSVIAQVLTKDEATIFIETGGLNKGGEQRLLKILENLLSVFDCKLRIVLLCKLPSDGVFDSFVEKIFGFSDPSFEQNCTPAKKPKLQSDGESEILQKEYQKSKEEVQEWKQKSKHWQKEAEKFKSEAASQSEENLKLSKNLQDQVKEWQLEANKSLKQVEQFKSEAAALGEENVKLSRKLEVMMSVNGKLKEQSSEIDLLKTKLCETEKDALASKNSLTETSNKLKESTVRIEELEQCKDSLESENSKAIAEMEAKDVELQNLRNNLNTKNEAVNMASGAGVSVLARKVLETDSPKDLKTVISEVREMAKVKNILLSEALQRKVKKLKLGFMYVEKGDKSIECEVRIQGGLEMYNLPVLTETGNGSSKNKAKNDAVVHLLAVLGSSE